MRRFGVSAAVVLAVTAPAWGAYPPLSAIPDGPPAPVGYPTAGYAPPGYQPMGYAPPGSVSLGFDGMPGYLPPIPMPPSTGGTPPPTTANPNGFAFDPCFPDQRSPRVVVHQEAWVRGDWLYWSLRSAPIPPLIVTGNPGLPGSGIPGSGNVASVVGPAHDLGSFNGARVTIGQWYDPDGELGGEISAFVLQRKGSNQQFMGSPTQSLSVPIVGTDGTIGVYDFSYPGRFTGALALQSSSFLWGGEANLLHRWYGDGCVSVDGLFGYRYLQLDERLDLLGRAQSVGAVSTFLGATLPTGTTVFTRDSFRARTDFQGAQIGARLEVRRSLFTVTAYGKGGVGANIQTLRVDGSTTATGPAGTNTAFGGLRGAAEQLRPRHQHRLLDDRRNRNRIGISGNEESIVPRRVQRAVVVGRAAPGQRD